MKETSRMFRFAVVGTVGFVVDGGVLQGLVSGLDMGPIAARWISFPTAVLATWLLNRAYTFSDSGQPSDSLLASLLRYIMVSLGGATVNFAVYSALVLLSATMHAWPILPLAIASVVAMAFNYLGARHFAFAARPGKSAAD